MEYLQWPANQRPLVPLMVFIDRTGVIRAQYSGYDTEFFGDAQDKNMREEAEKLLKEGAPAHPRSRAAKRAVKKSTN